MKPTLLKKLEVDKHYHHWGLFKCPYCGNEYKGRIEEVNSGRGYLHCGCQRNKKYSQGILNKNDLTGKTFGRLTVLENDTGLHDKNNNALRKCVCSCLNHTIVYKSHYYLTHAEEPSCGCVGKEKSSKIGKRNLKDLTGQKFGKLLVLKDSGKRKETDHGSNVIWECLCDCGNVAYISTNDLTTGNTKSCGCLQSSGNLCIKNILRQLNVQFSTEYSFKNCINPITGHILYFDFYLPDYNCCIEYDGQQHFSYSNNGWNTLEQVKETQYRDNIKNQYCKEHNINLIRIPHWDFDKLNEEYLLSLISNNT